MYEPLTCGVPKTPSGRFSSNTTSARPQTCPPASVQFHQPSHHSAEVPSSHKQPVAVGISAQLAYVQVDVPNSLYSCIVASGLKFVALESIQPKTSAANSCGCEPR